MTTLHIEDYKGYSITFNLNNGIATLVLTDQVIAYLIMVTSYIVNNHPSIKAIKDFKKLIDLYIQQKDT